MAHTFVQLLTSLICSGLLKLKDLLTEEILKELVLVANFEKLGTASLVVVKHDFELRNPLLALLAYPVISFLMGAIGTVALG